MLLLNESIRLRIVTRNSDMMYTVFGADVINSGDESWTIVGDYIGYSSPSTQNFFENEVPKSDTSFGS